MKLSIYQCQSKASKGSKFMAYFPAETVECEWVDPEMGTLRVNIPNLSDGLLTSEMIDKRYPDLLVSEPYEKGEE